MYVGFGFEFFGLDVWIVELTKSKSKPKHPNPAICGMLFVQIASTAGIQTSIDIVVSKKQTSNE